MPKAEAESKYWLDKVAAEVSKAHPKGELVVASGWSPSGPFHVGSLREVMTADALAYVLNEYGRDAKHLFFCDDLDPLRKLPTGVDPKFEQFIGQPYAEIPDPFHCHGSYADHYVGEFLDVIKPLKLDMEVMRANQLYKAGKFKRAFDQVEAKLDEIKDIIVEVSGRKLPDNWSPVQEFEGGTTKLNWRLDWPARWSIWNVSAEPFGRDHATKGGSYDTGKQLVKVVFGGKAPHPIPYEFINLKGESKKMSGSTGSGLTPQQVLEVMPPEILRYFVLRSKPERTLYFDPGIGIYNLVEEYSQVEQAVRSGQDHEFRRAYEVSSGGTAEQTISSVPFSHLVAIYQASLGDVSLGKEMLARTGYNKISAGNSPMLKREWQFVANWLSKYAPDEVKFEVQQKPPKVTLTAAQKCFLAELADKLEQNPDLVAQGIHDLIYATLEKNKLRPPEAFRAIYQVLLGKDQGPRAGWFLDTLERKLVLNRFRFKA